MYKFTISLIDPTKYCWIVIYSRPSLMENHMFDMVRSKRNVLPSDSVQIETTKWVGTPYLLQFILMDVNLNFKSTVNNFTFILIKKTNNSNIYVN